MKWNYGGLTFTKIEISKTYFNNKTQSTSYMYLKMSWTFKPSFIEVRKGQFIELKPEDDFSKMTHDIYILQTI